MILPDGGNLFCSQAAELGELLDAREVITKEARESAVYLHQEVEDIFAGTTEGKGEGRTEVKKRTIIMEKRETI